MPYEFLPDSILGVDSDLDLSDKRHIKYGVSGDTSSPHPISEESHFIPPIVTARIWFIKMIFQIILIATMISGHLQYQ